MIPFELDDWVAFLYSDNPSQLSSSLALYARRSGALPYPEPVRAELSTSCPVIGGHSTTVLEPPDLHSRPSQSYRRHN